MFADSLSDSPWANQSHRGWTTLVSFALQALLVGAALALPLISTQGLPRLQAVVEALPVPASLSEPVPQRAAHSAASTSNVLSDGRLLQPRAIPASIPVISENIAPPPVDAGQLGVSGGTGVPSAANGIWGGAGNGRLAALAPPPPMAQAPLRLSHIMEGNLTYRVQPTYPALARIARIQGTVVLQAIISKQGTIEHLQVVSGPPMLVQAAVDAVQQWRYRPYLLNNEPVEVETQVTVNFVLGGG
jgi:periplasmic protein TonB